MLSKQTLTSKHIIVLPTREQGNTHVIADLHGNRQCLEAVLKETIEQNAEDILCILGDLTDRGEDSPGVVALLKEAQAKYPDRIFVIRGNHEASCLKTISILEEITRCYQNEFTSLPDKSQVLPFINSMKDQADLKTFINSINIHVHDGGLWLLQLFYQELKNQKIVLNEDGETLTYSNDSQIKSIRDYMRALPYIIKYNEHGRTPPFVAAHAAVLFSDEILEKRIQLNKPLEDKEIDYTIWARSEDIKEKSQRGAFPNLAYVGHNIVLIPGNESVRSKDNSINLDFAAFKKNIIAVVNHEQGTCKLVGATEKALKDAENDPKITTHITNINTHLKSQVGLYKILHAMKRFTSAKNIIAMLGGVALANQEYLIQAASSKGFISKDIADSVLEAIKQPKKSTDLPPSNVFASNQLPLTKRPINEKEIAETQEEDAKRSKSNK